MANKWKSSKLKGGLIAGVAVPPTLLVVREHADGREDWNLDDSYHSLADAEQLADVLNELEAYKALGPVEELAALRDKNKNLRQALADATRNNHKRNIELDALHFVWCDGGCWNGTHRYTEGEITEEIVAVAERNTKRLRQWFINSEGKKRDEEERQCLKEVIEDVE